MSQHKSLLIVRACDSQLLCFYLNKEQGQSLYKFDFKSKTIERVTGGSGEISSHLKHFEILASYSYPEIHAVFQSFPRGRGLSINNCQSSWLEIGSYFLGLHNGSPVKAPRLASIDGSNATDMLPDSFHLLKDRLSSKTKLGQHCDDLVACFNECLTMTAEAAPVRLKQPYVLNRRKANRHTTKPEDQLEEALWRKWNLRRVSPVSGCWHRLMSYQAMLRNTNQDKKWGEVDLLGVLESGMPSVVELKIQRSFTPLQCLLEAAAYGVAIKKAWNDDDCSLSSRWREELTIQFGCMFDSLPRPLPKIVRMPLVIAATDEYWDEWIGDTLKARKVQEQTGDAFTKCLNIFNDSGFDTTFLSLKIESNTNQKSLPLILETSLVDVAAKLGRAKTASVVRISRSCHSAYRLCKDLQIRWANNVPLKLQGSKGSRGKLAYTMALDENLFQPLSNASRRDFESGNGNELASNGSPCKLQAVHSSASIAVNVFEYWRQLGAYSPLLDALGLPHTDATGLRFEAKLPIMADPRRHGFPVDPNLDVLIDVDGSSLQCIGVECKFTELYRRSEPAKKGMPAAYLRRASLWDGLPACRALAEELSPSDDRFVYLHAAQLLKHLLGLRYRANCANNAFQLLYIWFDTDSDESRQHAEELTAFSRIVISDGIAFRSITFQEMIGALSRYAETYSDYVAYLRQRYLSVPTEP